MASLGKQRKIGLAQCAVRQWKIAGNWRHTETLDASDSRADELIAGEDNRAAVDLQFHSTDPAEAEFLRPVKGSPLTEGGGASGLPAYAGALPPAGIAVWDWENTWRERFDPAQAASDQINGE